MQKSLSAIPPCVNNRSCVSSHKEGYISAAMEAPLRRIVANCGEEASAVAEQVKKAEVTSVTTPVRASKP